MDAMCVCPWNWEVCRKAWHQMHHEGLTLEDLQDVWRWGTYHYSQDNLERREAWHGERVLFGLSFEDPTLGNRRVRCVVQRRPYQDQDVVISAYIHGTENPEIHSVGRSRGRSVRSTRTGTAFHRNRTFGW